MLKWQYLPGNLTHMVVRLEHFTHLVGQSPQGFNDLAAGQVAHVVQAAEVQRQQRESETLRGVGLGGRDADFRAGVQVDASVRFLRDGAADHVADGQGGMALAFHFAQGRQRIGGFTALGDRKQQRPVIDRRIAVTQLAGVLDFHRQPGQFFDRVFAHERRMPTRAARRQDDAIHAPQFARGQIQPAKHGRRILFTQATAHGVLQRLGLFENLLQHVVGIAVQFDSAAVDDQRFNAELDLTLLAMRDPHRLGRDHRHLMVGQVDDLLGVARQR